MIQEQIEQQWQAKVRSCQTMILEGSTHPDFTLYLAVDAELTRLRAELNSREDRIAELVEGAVTLRIELEKEKVEVARLTKVLEMVYQDCGEAGYLTSEVFTEVVHARKGERS